MRSPIWKVVCPVAVSKLRTGPGSSALREQGARTSITRPSVRPLARMFLMPIAQVNCKELVGRDSKSIIRLGKLTDELVGDYSRK
jgi:hypothetical protein